MCSKSIFAFPWPSGYSRVCSFFGSFFIVGYPGVLLLGRCLDRILVNGN